MINSNQDCPKVSCRLSGDRSVRGDAEICMPPPIPDPIPVRPSQIKPKPKMSRCQKFHYIMWVKEIKKLGKGQTLGSILCAFIAEFFGTAILIYLGCMGAIYEDKIPILHKTDKLNNIEQALSFGLTYGILCVMTSHLSHCHLNPILTLASVIVGQIKGLMMPIYLIAQLLGGFLGYNILNVMIPNFLTGGVCATVPTDWNLWKVLLSEYIGCAVLVATACSCWDSRNSSRFDLAWLQLGLTYTMLCMVLIPYNGCGMNPTRTFVAAYMEDEWKDHWVYWVASILSTATVASIYRFLFHAGKKN